MNLTTATAGVSLQRTGPADQPATDFRQTTFQIVGFDRLHFVADVTNRIGGPAVPQHESCRLMGLSFEVNGARVNGWLRLQLPVGGDLTAINRQLRAVKGVVSITQTN